MSREGHLTALRAGQAGARSGIRSYMAGFDRSRQGRGQKSLLVGDGLGLAGHVLNPAADVAVGELVERYRTQHRADHCVGRPSRWRR